MRWVCNEGIECKGIRGSVRHVEERKVADHLAAHRIDVKHWSFSSRFVFFVQAGPTRATRYPSPFHPQGGVQFSYEGKSSGEGFQYKL